MKFYCIECREVYAQQDLQSLETMKYSEGLRVEIEVHTCGNGCGEPLLLRVDE